MGDTIGNLLRKTREEKRLSKIEVCGGLITESTYRNIENDNCSIDIWIIRFLLGRLQICDSAVTYYVSDTDNMLTNLESDIYQDIMVYDKCTAVTKLNKFFELADTGNPYQMIIYYRLFLLVHGKETSRTEIDNINHYLRLFIDTIEERLTKRLPLSPEELGFITEYYNFIFENVQEKIEKLYEIYDYYKQIYAVNKLGYRFFSQLCLYYAQCLFELKEYATCIEKCKDGLTITSLFCTANNTAALYELMADAENELTKITSKNGDVTTRYNDIIEHYNIAKTLYKYCGSQNNPALLNTIEEKISSWKVMQSHK